MLDNPEKLTDPKPLLASVLLGFGAWSKTKLLPPATVNFHKEAQRSVVEEWLIVKTVPTALVPEETNRQIEVVTPSPAAPPTVLVCS